MTDRPLPQTTLREQRERTVAQLCEHFAQDRLELAEFESRVDAAQRASTAEQLDTLLRDLPAHTTAPPARPDDMPAAGRLRAQLRDTRAVIAVMGGVERKGRWRPARRTVVLSLMGGATLDFRDAELPPGETELFLLCMMGGADIIVPPGLAVDASGIAIMGGFGHSTPPISLPADAPVLHISGLCLMGGVDIAVRLPGETAKEARQRHREERRRLRGRDRE